MILAGNEGTPVEGKRHVPIVGPRAEVGCSSPTANILHLVAAQHEHHKPVSVVGVAVGQFASPRLSGAAARLPIEAAYKRRPLVAQAAGVSAKARALARLASAVATAPDSAPRRHPAAAQPVLLPPTARSRVTFSNACLFSTMYGSSGKGIRYSTCAPGEWRSFSSFSSCA